MGFFEDIADAYQREYGVGVDENRLAMFEAREKKGKAPDAPRGAQMLGSYRTGQAIKSALGFKEDPAFSEARRDLDIDFDTSTPGKRVGTALGALTADAIQDSTRRFWWLLNAAQATGDIIAEQAVAKARPDLYDTVVKDRMVTNVMGEKELQPRRARKYAPGAIQAIVAPAGFALNTGLGLMTPFGGAEGYKAALPSEEDPNKTSNVLGEVALKYFMGRTGDLLPYNEFVKVRPDVSKDEYMRYKAFKFDKNEDWNPADDGQTSMLAGALRTTDEGIHGPEVQFLGRSVPLTTGLTPFLAATAGGAMGARYGGTKPVRRGVYGGLGGLIVGTGLGNLFEGERRRRNAAENERDRMQF